MTETVVVDRIFSANHLQKAEEFARSMKGAQEQRDWDATVTAAVHCAISAADALCVFSLGLRHKGEDHRGAVSLFRSISAADERFHKNAQRLAEILSLKSDAEYSERLLKEREAELAVQQAERLLGFVKERLAGMGR